MIRCEIYDMLCDNTAISFTISLGQTGTKTVLLRLTFENPPPPLHVSPGGVIPYHPELTVCHHKRGEKQKLAYRWQHPKSGPANSKLIKVLLKNNNILYIINLQ